MMFEFKCYVDIHGMFSCQQRVIRGYFIALCPWYLILMYDPLWLTDVLASMTYSPKHHTNVVMSLIMLCTPYIRVILCILIDFAPKVI